MAKLGHIGRTTVAIDPLGFGGGTLGDPSEITSDEQAQSTLASAWDHGVRYFDTAPWYGTTKSEHRLGQFLRGKPREDFVISTKVGRIFTRPDDVDDFKRNSPWAKRWLGGLPFDLRFDYTYDGIMRAYEDSLNRLGLPRVDCLTIHDLDTRHHPDEDAVAEGFRQLENGRGFAALRELKSHGEIGAIGAGINLMGSIPCFVERFEMDYFLLAGPYTLLDQPALDGELPLCEENGISIILGGVFASGILATGPIEGALYRYQAADPEILKKVEDISRICAAHNVSLSAAALRFPLYHPSVVTVIPGANHPDQVISNCEAFSTDIPDTLWVDLKDRGILRRDAPTA